MNSIFLKTPVHDTVAKYQQALTFICQREAIKVPFSEKVTLIANEDDIQSKLHLL